MIVIIMGVSGCGKTTIGRRLATDLGWPFHDADDFHPLTNIAKMRKGIPLTDKDRAPWLAAIHNTIARYQANHLPAVLTCSALRQAYRDALAPAGPDLRFIHLKGTYEQILARMQGRADHFMPPELLQSQFATLEEPADALTLDVSRPPAELVATIRSTLGI